MIDLDRLSTEQRNPASVAIDTVSTQELVEIINREDHKVADAVEKILPAIALAVDLVADRLSRGGRLFYMGSGTSGRLGILDAVECPPTYSTDPEQIQGLIAGGYEAIFRAKEGAEDSEEQGRDDIWNKELTPLDVVMGISASGRTPYVLGGMKEARERGCAVLGLCCSRQSAMAKLADLCLTVLPGPEVITGSTRMKAGTATKMVLNMITTGAMVKLGKVRGNLMIDVRATNEKLLERALHIVCTVTGCSREEARLSLARNRGSARKAVEEWEAAHGK
ncbi:N-acetylmuramic acid 6-phosphate etherase [Acidaminococcus fermentans]|uniref:N-acetylmuramic acid 6-phosphate etherase n=1 Tax=Acidaminococcus fermentans TaxID=905 RepID=UPI00242A5D9D|nr:N-acetylmuramic acid 6-phosphate etherase [Acidaminococcus fermentans]